MLEVREHKRVLSGVRETKGRALGGHKEAVDELRRAWRRSRQPQPALHRVVLASERQEMRAGRRLHKTMLAQNRWLLALAERLQGRLKKAG